jgi:hypothetical protein
LEAKIRTRLTAALMAMRRAHKEAKKLKAERNKKKKKKLRRSMLVWVGLARKHFKKAMEAEKKDKNRKSKMRHIANVLELYIWVNKHLGVSESDVRNYFSKKSWVKKRLFGAAESVYRNVYPNMIRLLSREDLGKGKKHYDHFTEEDFDFFEKFVEVMANKLSYTQRLEKAGIRPSFPPTLEQMKKYFETLSKESHYYNKKAYNEYASSFFFHPKHDVSYPLNNEDASIVYSMNMDEYGRRIADCEGFALLGRHLFEEAGYSAPRSNRYITRTMLPRGYKHGDEVPEAHVVAELERTNKSGTKDVVFVSSRKAWGSKHNAFSKAEGTDWKNPKGTPVDGYGNTRKKSHDNMMANIEAQYRKR